MIQGFSFPTNIDGVFSTALNRLVSIFGVCDNWTKTNTAAYRYLVLIFLLNAYNGATIIIKTSALKNYNLNLSNLNGLPTALPSAPIS
jgi:hypothetical protein